VSDADIEQEAEDSHSAEAAGWPSIAMGAVVGRQAGDQAIGVSATHRN
jgi:hypothetical protein